MSHNFCCSFKWSMSGPKNFSPDTLVQPLSPGPPCSSWTPVQSKSNDWRNALDTTILELERTEECFNQIQGDERLGYRLLKKKNPTAGAILVHCFSIAKQVIDKHEPLIYKFGLTHCPHTRWWNKRFGYCKEKAGWQQLLVLHVSLEPISTAFIEAALIQKYKGHWDGKVILFDLCIVPGQRLILFLCNYIYIIIYI